MEFTPKLIDDLLDRAARDHGGHVAVVADGERLTYQDFLERVERVAAGLQALGVEPGERVAILDKNGPRYLELYFALPRIGAVAVPLNYRLAVPELAFILGDSHATTLFFGSEYAATVATLRGELPALTRAVVLDGALPNALVFDAIMAPPGARARRPERHPDTVFLQMYTSGTTGRPKGALLTHDNLIANTLTALAERDYTSADRYLHVAPLYHIADLELFFGMTYACARNVLVREFRPERVLEVIQSERVTVSFLVPAMINALLEHPSFDAHDIASLRLIVYGGSSIPEDRLRTALARLRCKLAQGYGLTETSPLLCVLPSEDHVLEGPRARRIRSCGRPAHAVEVKIFDEHERECAVEQVGEIVARGRNVMQGYYERPEATAEALRGGWFHTGDLGFRDADGYVYIVDRKKDMIITGAENVYPREVEEVLYTHPAVLDAAVIGVPSERWGETIKAVVVLREGRTASERELIDFARERLAHYKAPTSVDFVAALPRNPSGKVLKRQLREPYWQGHARRVN
jgi:acyl-CoA synthetase (AMP-forming)/AMP-acid ligase II